MGDSPMTHDDRFLLFLFLLVCGLAWLMWHQYTEDKKPKKHEPTQGWYDSDLDEFDP